MKRLLRKLLGVHYRGRHTRAARRLEQMTPRTTWAELTRTQPEPAPSDVDGAFSAIVAELPDLAERFRSINSVMGGGTAEEVTPQ